ncbi:MAG: IclR family transcriptional regulator [Pseudonocardiales bacterium]|nr:IclR family transcriptional regulator [Pseudonocardiales bacterium]
MSELAGGNSTRTVDRALALLAEVCDHDSVSLAQCARSTHLPASTALRLLRTLEARAFVRRDEGGSFRAGPRMIQLGAMTFGRQALATLAEPALRRIVSECGETTYLFIAGPPGSALTIGMVDGTFSVRHSSWIGHRIPIGNCAIGRAMAGGLNNSSESNGAREPARERFVAMPMPAEPDVTAIAAAVERPLIGASVPARRTRADAHAVVGVISVVGPTYRLDDERIRAIGSIVSRECIALGESFASIDASLLAPSVVPERLVIPERPQESHESEVQAG